MPNKTIALVEDTTASLDVITYYLRKNHPDLQIVGEARSVDEACQLLSRQKPDIALLDINILGGTSFDVLARLTDAGTSPLPQLIFITAHGERENVIKALRYSALDFITKNVDEYELEQAIARAIERVDTHESIVEGVQSMIKQQRRGDPFDQLVVRLVAGVRRQVYVRDVIYFEAQREMTNVHVTTYEQPLKAAINIGHYRQMLRDDHDFLLIHQSLLVNSLHIEDFDGKKGEIRLKTGQRLSTSANGNTVVRDYYRRKEERSSNTSLLGRLRRFLRGSRASSL